MSEDLKKENEDLRHQNMLLEQAEKERKVSDERYAIKLVERIVFGAVGLVLIAVLTAIVALVVRK